MSARYILEMLGMSKSFPGVKALDDVTLRVRPGTVHALMGENGAGKSTLMKCLFGIHQPDAGRVLLGGAPVHFQGPRDALEAGVSMIHQELSVVPDRTVQENVWLGREPRRRVGPLRLLDHRRMRDDTAALMRRLEMDVPPGARMRSLSISQQQACEIARAVSFETSAVVMDEPTSSLTERETDHLFRIIDDLRGRGVAILYISHKMSEIFRIADEVSVMRDGRMIGTWPAAELDEERLIAHMVGRDTSHRFPRVAPASEQVRLRVEGLTSADPRSFRQVSFALHRGEILGVGGLVGAQRTELVEALFGLRPIASGTVALDGKPIGIRSSGDAIRRGLALITEDRRESGIIPQMSVTMNTGIAALDRYLRKGGILLDHRALAREAARLNQALRTRTPSMDVPIRNLSGGNQQKVLVSRWLMTLPEILIMDEPTRGIDVGAKLEIYTLMAELAGAGKSILMVSSEMAELLGMSHRVLVLCAGRHTGTLRRDEATQESVMRLATQFS